jgi:hypothetical protein
MARENPNVKIRPLQKFTLAPYVLQRTERAEKGGDNAE